MLPTGVDKSITHVAIITKLYKLVPVGKVATGLSERNGSPLLDLRLISASPQTSEPEIGTDFNRSLRNNENLSVIYYFRQSTNDVTSWYSPIGCR